MFPYWILLTLCSAAFVQARDGGVETPSTTSHPPTSESESYASTSTYYSPTPSSSATAPRIQFDQPQNTSTCASTRLSWTFDGGVSMPLTIQVTNAFQSQVMLKPGFTRMMVTYRTLTTNVPSTASRLDWSTVDVPTGFYTAVAFDPAHPSGVFAQSPTFFVASGEASCLPNSTSSSASASTPTSPAGDSSSNSPSGPKHLSTGALAGAIAGSVAGVLIIVAACTVPRLIRHHLPSRRNRNPHEGPYYLF